MYRIVLWKDAVGIKDLQGTALVGNNFYEDNGDYVHWIFRTRAR